MRTWLLVWSLSFTVSFIARSALAQDTQVTRANAWVAFEQRQDEARQRGERIFFPVSLGIQAGLGAWIATGDMPTSSRISLGFGSGLAAAAILPTVLASRDRSRTWFGLGSAAFGVGFGTSLILLDAAHSHHGQNLTHGGGYFTGAAVALQALMMIPVAFIPGLPSEHDYEAYRQLPDAARPEAAARILHQVDKYEQRVAALVLLGNLVSAATLAAGVIAVHDRQDRREMGAVALVPLTTALIAIVPRLFFDSRVDRYATGAAPQRLGLNVW